MRKPTIALFIWAVFAMVLGLADVSVQAASAVRCIHDNNCPDLEAN